MQNSLHLKHKLANQNPNYLFIHSLTTYDLVQCIITKGHNALWVLLEYFMWATYENYNGKHGIRERINQ